MPGICSQFATYNRQLNIFVKSLSCSNNFSNIFAMISSSVTMLVPFLLLSSITDVFIYYLGIVDLANVIIKKIRPRIALDKEQPSLLINYQLMKSSYNSISEIPNNIKTLWNVLYGTVSRMILSCWAK